MYTNGPLPGEAFKGLDKLNYFDLGQNNYNTTIPNELVKLPNLEKLYLDHVKFTNLDFTLDFITRMPKIFECWIDNTPISGGIPTEIGELTFLASFSATSCGLDGSIPTEMGNLIMMDRLWLYQNKLTGTIPSEMGNMSLLKILYVEGNALSGAMPDEVCQLKDDAMSLKELGADCQVDSKEVDCACCTCCGPIACGDLVR